MENSSYYSILVCMSNSLIYLDGVNSINIKKSTSFDNEIFLGGVRMPNSLNQPNEITVSIDKSFVEHDPIYSLTGENKIDFLYFNNGTTIHRIDNLYLTSLQASFTVGDLPKMSFSLSSYNGQTNQISLIPNLNSAIKNEKLIPKLNSISVELFQLDQSSNIKNNINIYSIDYSVNINRNPIYSIGDYNETEVIQMLPIQTSASISSKLKNTGETFIINPFYLRDDPLKFYDFNINISGNQNKITKFPMRNTKFISCDINSNSQGFLDIKYNFNGLLGGHYAN